MPIKVYDIVFIGGGLSSSATLYYVLSGLQKNKNPGRAIHIAVIEKNNEFWKGIPYGNRSSIQSLTINPIKDFFQDNEKSVFFNWLNDLRENYWADIADQEKVILDNWLAKNADKLNDNDIEGLYIPRFLYGIYLSQKLENIIAECKADNLADVDLISGEAVDTTKVSDNEYLVDIQKTEEKITVTAHILILGTGSLDSKQITNGIVLKHLCIDDIYHPSLTSSLKLLADALLLIEPAKRNILIIGSNASASEIVHMLYNAGKTQQNSFNKISILSSSGCLPQRLYVNTDYDHMLETLKGLEQTGNYTADALMGAIEADVAFAAKKQLSVGEIHYSLSDRVVKMQQKLNADEALRFFNHHGWAFTRITRRTSEDYYITEKELVAAGKLDFIKGRFIKLSDEQHNGEGLTFIYKGTDNMEKQHETAFPIIIHCGGAESISSTSSKLIKNLLDKNICKINHNQMGLAVDEHFAANNNLYVMGPLLAGIYNSKFKFWHLENAKRLNGLAAILSTEILSKLDKAN